MNLIDKILMEGLWSNDNSIYDMDYYTNIDPKLVKKKAYIVASKFGVYKVQQAKTGSCYFYIFNPINHFIYEVRISTHPSSHSKEKNYQLIDLSYSQSTSEMIRIIQNKLNNSKIINH